MCHLFILGEFHPSYKCCYVLLVVFPWVGVVGALDPCYWYYWVIYMLSLFVFSCLVYHLTLYLSRIYPHCLCWFCQEVRLYNWSNPQEGHWIVYPRMVPLDNLCPNVRKMGTHVRCGWYFSFRYIHPFISMRVFYCTLLGDTGVTTPCLASISHRRFCVYSFCFSSWIPFWCSWCWTWWRWKMLHHMVCLLSCHPHWCRFSVFLLLFIFPHIHHSVTSCLPLLLCVPPCPHYSTPCAISDPSLTSMCTLVSPFQSSSHSLCMRFLRTVFFVLLFIQHFCVQPIRNILYFFEHYIFHG